MATKYPFELRFNKKAIREWADGYPRDYDRETYQSDGRICFCDIVLKD